MQKIKWNLSGVIVFTSIIATLNSLMIFLFIIYFYLDKGNIVAILFAEKILILDISVVCAIGKALKWPVFKYLTKLQVENDDIEKGGKKITKRKNSHF